jgi:hypothetical protein
MYSLSQHSTRSYPGVTIRLFICYFLGPTSLWVVLLGWSFVFSGPPVQGKLRYHQSPFLFTCHELVIFVSNLKMAAHFCCKLASSLDRKSFGHLHLSITKTSLTTYSTREPLWLTSWRKHMLSSITMTQSKGITWTSRWHYTLACWTYRHRTWLG